MVYLRFHLFILVPFWSLVAIILMFFSQIISSSSKFNNQALTIVKSIDDYLCQNYVLTCFFRQRYHRSLYVQQQENNICKSFLILHSCLQNDNDSIRMCQQAKLSQVKLTLANETPIHCSTSLVYRSFQMQHVRSIGLRKTIIYCPMLFVSFLTFHFIYH